MTVPDLEGERRFHALLEQALGSDTASREALLVSLEDEEPGLAKELRHCLQEGESDMMDAFLEGPAVKLAQGSEGPLVPDLLASPRSRRRGPAPESWRVKIKSRRTIGPYNLLEVVGTGGVGKVYRAELPRVADGSDPLPPDAVDIDGNMRRIVALKVLRGVLTEKAARRHFVQAMSELRKLSHPNVAALIGGGVEEDGRAYYASEWVSGLTLTRYCRQYRSSLSQRLSLVLGVCRGLEHAHASGYLHLGLKPSNILVSTDGDEPCAKVTDTGIFAALPDALNESAVLTRGGLEMALYVCPESIDGELGHVDGQSDVYALGILLFELCVGVLPIEVESLSPVRVVQAVLQNEPVTLSERWQGLDEATRKNLAIERQATVNEMTQALGGELQEVVGQAMARAKEDRLASVGALRQRLEGLLNG